MIPRPSNPAESEWDSRGQGENEGFRTEPGGEPMLRARVIQSEPWGRRRRGHGAEM